ncbi:MAG: hypothetical protein GY898_27630 [Proteobacteria bacterium]|nr:hypothetical protein [Pseudomonadota bacterium]
MRLLLALAAVAMLVGCPQPMPSGDVEPNYLRLQSFVSVDAGAGSLEGFLRWIYVADDPEEFETPREACEVWELLELERVEPGEACLDCTDQFDGTASLVDEDTTCDDADWEPRSFTMAFGPLDLIDEPDFSDLDSQGYDFSVHTRWSPELGDSQGFQDLFAANGEQWASDTGEAGSTDSVEGQYHLFCRYFWELS